MVFRTEFEKGISGLKFKNAWSMVVTYYINFFHTGTDRHNSILMSLLLLVEETIKVGFSLFVCELLKSILFVIRKNAFLWFFKLSF